MVEVTLPGRTQYQLGIELTKKQRHEGTKNIELIWRQDRPSHLSNRELSFRG